MGKFEHWLFKVGFADIIKSVSGRKGGNKSDQCVPTQYDAFRSREIEKQTHFDDILRILS